MTSRHASRLNTAAIAAGLVTSAVGVALLWGAGVEFRTAVPPGVIILPVAALVVAFAPWRFAPGIGALVGLYATVGFVATGGVVQLAGQDGAGAAIGRWVQLSGLLAALAAGARGLLANYRAYAEATLTNAPPAADSQPREVRRATWGCRAQVLGLVVLAPIGAEYLAAYDDSTGDPARLLLGLLILSPLYGCPALVIREVARRAGLGWVGMILMATAFGLLQAGVVDQSLFSVGYRGIESWEESMRATLVAPFGFSAHMALAFVGGHAIYSICAPIALVEAFRAQHREGPWLAKAGLAVTAVVYLAASTLILAEHLSTEASHASAAQVVGSLLVACCLVAGAFILGRRPRPKAEGEAPRPLTVFVASLVASGALAFAPETRPGVALAAGVLVVSAVCLARASRARAWDARHVAAVAAGAVLSRALLAFTYFPVVGDVSPARKYSHNVVLLVAMAVVSWLAARRASSREAGEDPDPK